MASLKFCSQSLVDDTSFDNSLYEGIGSGVKEAPELHYDTRVDVEQKNIESCGNQEKELSPEMGIGLKKFEGNINKFWESAENAARRGKLKSLEVDDASFFLEYSEDSIVEVAKIIDGTKKLGLNQGDIAFGGNIVKIGKSEVEIEVENGIRDYTDISDGGDVILIFPTSLGELEVRLYPDKQDKGLIRVEVKDQEKWENLKNCNEKIGKIAYLVGIQCIMLLTVGILKGLDIFNLLKQSAYLRKFQKKPKQQWKA